MSPPIPHNEWTNRERSRMKNNQNKQNNNSRIDTEEQDIVVNIGSWAYPEFVKLSEIRKKVHAVGDDCYVSNPKAASYPDAIPQEYRLSRDKLHELSRISREMEESVEAIHYDFCDRSSNSMAPDEYVSDCSRAKMHALCQLEVVTYVIRMKCCLGSCPWQYTPKFVRSAFKEAAATFTGMTGHMLFDLTNDQAYMGHRSIALWNAKRPETMGYGYNPVFFDLFGLSHARCSVQDPTDYIPTVDDLHFMLEYGQITQEKFDSMITVQRPQHG